jgi:hypothetical protein
MTAFMSTCFYAAMVMAALIVEGVFALAGWIPERHASQAGNPSITMNCTSVLDIVFGLLFLALIVVFWRSGGLDMMRMMKDGGHRHAERDAHRI